MTNIILNVERIKTLIKRNSKIIFPYRYTTEDTFRVLNKMTENVCKIYIKMGTYNIETTNRNMSISCDIDNYFDTLRDGINQSNIILDKNKFWEDYSKYVEYILSHIGEIRTK
jgi:hypothetical protein